MKIMRLAIVVSLLMFLLPCGVAFAGAPSYPHFFYGSVKVYPEGNMSDLRDVPPGAVITAEVDGQLKGSLTVTMAGKYGGPLGGDGKLLVQDTIPSGSDIIFYIVYKGTPYPAQEVSVREEGEYWKDVAPEWVATFTSGEIWGLNLIAMLPPEEVPPPVGPMGGVGLPTDTTPPVISGCGLCPGADVTETTADICWRTNEAGTSQVEYWSSPSILSPLDETLVIEHHVELAGLTPGTTYYYKTMSKDAAGNLAVSDVFTFTTAGEAPAVAPAYFSVSNLSIKPTEVAPEEVVTITVSVANTGDTEGTCTVVLKIAGVKEAEESVTVAAGSSEIVTFSTTREEAGIYIVVVNGLSASFTVVAPVVMPAAAPPPPPAPAAPPAPPAPVINWLLIGGIIAALVIMALLIYFLVARPRRRAY